MAELGGDFTDDGEKRERGPRILLGCCCTPLLLCWVWTSLAMLKLEVALASPGRASKRKVCSTKKGNDAVQSIKGCGQRRTKSTQ